jgi:hypothetical protein
MKPHVAVLTLCALSVSSVASAQTGSSPGRVEGMAWRPELSVDPNALPWVEGTLVPGAANWNTGAIIEYVRQPLMLRAGGEDVPLVRDQLWTTLSAQVGIGTRMAFALQVPLLFYQASETGNTGAPEPASAAVGDLRAVLRWTTRRELPLPSSGANSGANGSGQMARLAQQQRESREGFGLSLNLAATVPVSDARSYATWGAPTVHLYGVTDFRLFRIVASLSLGYRLRIDEHWPAQSGTCVDATSPACLFDVPLRDQITWGFAIRQPLEGLLALIFLGISPRLASASILAGYFASTYVTFQGAIDARAPFASAASTPVEMGAGLQRTLGEFTLSLGAAWALTASPGAARVRAIASVQWAPRFVDEDRDGLRDDPGVDQCIGLAEDFDGFEDNDGCPEDNDHDAVPDEEDRCPRVDEDEDGFEDEDGCPDPDNDHDEVLDADDACPDEAPGEHPDTTRRGCPNNDADGDAINAPEDLCPDEAQGAHPDPARRGCPLPDGDDDGVPDADDACPTESAGSDAEASQQGCPETDHDHDGVLDAQDRCAGQAETINGVQDEDGCPEAPPAPGVVVPGAYARVRIVRANPRDAGTVVLNEPVLFSLTDTVLPASRPLLRQLAVALRATARVPSRWWELSVARSPTTVLGPAAISAARAVRRRDAVIAILRELGVTDRVLRPGEPAAPLSARVIAAGGDRGVVLILHAPGTSAPPPAAPPTPPGNASPSASLSDSVSPQRATVL